ncbi:MAG: RNA polymerase sigma factor [Pyrinomonadaceae bacterium]
MKGSYNLDQQGFDDLLRLLSEDRDEAALRYGKLREGLVRFFEFRGCSDHDYLADETLNRVAAKAGSFDKTSGVAPASYIYGFARNVLLEYMRGPKNRESQLEWEHFQYSTDSETVPDDRETDLACLESCLEDLRPEDGALVLEYFSRERREKIELRRVMAERLGGPQVLQSRIFRIKATLKACIRRCREKKRA